MVFKNRGEEQTTNGTLGADIDDVRAWDYTTGDSTIMVVY